MEGCGRGDLKQSMGLQVLLVVGLLRSTKDPGSIQLSLSMVHSPSANTRGRGALVEVDIACCERRGGPLRAIGRVWIFMAGLVKLAYNTVEYSYSPCA